MVNKRTPRRRYSSARPLEIADEEHEQVLERVAAIDVGKQWGQVCLRLPEESVPGRRTSRVWDVASRTRAVRELGQYLASQQVQKVSLESASDYWRIFYYLLEACGLDVQLANARDMRNVPGRPKSDVLDCVWQAKVTERGMVRPSFVPPPQIRVLRDYTRLRVDLTQERTRHWQRLEKLLEDALIKVSAVASKMTTKSVRAMLDALVRGERNPRVLAGLALGRMRAKHDALVEALDGCFDDHHGELVAILLGQADSLDTRIDTLDTRIGQLLAAIPAAAAPAQPPGGGNGAQAPPLPAMERLAEIPGVGTSLAQAIIAEVGLDMTRFPTSGHLTSWGRVSPRTNQSGAKTKPGRTGKGNRYLKAALGQAAASAGRTNTFLGARYRRLAKRRGSLKAQVAVARSILVIAWHLLADPTARFHELGQDFYATRIDKERKIKNHVQQLEALGFNVALTPAA